MGITEQLIFRTADAGACHGAPSNDFAAMGVDDEGGPDDVPFPACELQAIGASAQVRTQSHDFELLPNSWTGG
jgi:hypothetical protein